MCSSVVISEVAKRTNKSFGIMRYFSNTIDDSLHAVIARMVLSIPFNKFCKSYDLQKLLNTKGYNEVPKSPNSINNMVIKCGETIREKIIQELSFRIR